MPRAKRQLRCPVLPYRKALRAYAYAGKKLEDALRVIFNLGFETPQPDHKLYPVLKAQMAEWRRESWNINHQFNLGHHASDDIEPMYSYALAHDKDKIVSFYNPEKVAFLDRLFMDIRSVKTRKIVDVCLMSGYQPEQISDIMSCDFIGCPVQWQRDDVIFYSRFLWNFHTMQYEDWQSYKSWMRVHDNHFYDYIQKIDDPRERSVMLSRLYIPRVNFREERERYRVDERIVDNAYMNLLEETSKPHDIKTSINILKTFDKQISEKPATINEKQNITQENLRVILSRHDVNTENLSRKDVRMPEPISVRDLEGDFNDPTDINRKLESLDDGKEE